MIDSKPLAIVPAKTDKETAADIKNELVEALTPVLAVLDRAVAAGFAASFTLGPGVLGKQTIAQLRVIKEF